jgi:cytochrome d ubiquinol oxidase subunit I
MEGHWDGRSVAPLYLFAWPDEAAETNRAALGIPKLGSLIITHDANGLFPGLKDFPRDERPPVAVVFYAFRVMVGIGIVMIVAGLAGAWLWWRGRVFASPRWLRIVGYMWPLGFVAILAGWTVTESGRQPWLVHGVLRTADALSPVSGPAVAASFALIVVTYSIVFSIGVYYVRRLIRKGPVQGTVTPGGGVPNRPLSAAQQATRSAQSGELAI